MSNTNSMRLQNFIDAATDGNYKFANEVFTRHDSLLHSGIADSEINALYTAFHTLRTNYYTAYTAWQNLQGQAQGGTQGFVAQMEDLSTNKIRIWDVAIQAAYDQKSVKYKTLLPNRHNPFQKGSYESRVAAVGTLIAAIGTDASLATLKTSITTFYTALAAARDSQIGGFAGIDTAISNLENTRLAAAQGMFKNYGTLVAKYAATPDAVGNYIPMDLLTAKPQTTFTGHTSASGTSFILKRKLDPDATMLLLVNNGEGPIEFFFTDGNKDTPEPGFPVALVRPNSQQQLPPTMCGYNDLKRNLYIRNTGIAEASWSVRVE